MRSLLLAGHTHLQPIVFDHWKLIIRNFLLEGCTNRQPIVFRFNSVPKMNRVNIGMTKDEVIKILGSPVSVSAKDDAEYLNYNFSESETKKSHEITAPYFVRLINGKVESYGRL